MDQLFSHFPKRSYLISSSDIPDETGDIDVGADDMLINAINQMNRSNERYVFLDQARTSGFGTYQITTTRKGDEIQPELYIRGAISQRDANASDDETSVAHAAGSNSGSSITGALFGGNRTLSVISVDLHLVQYPSRRIIPGASVANSMVVVEKGFNATAVGIIDNAILTVPLTIERIESESQAVRNLVELGIIELLGRHSGVPYWTCLENPSTDARVSEKDEKQFVRGSSQQAVSHAQEMLIQLGLLEGEPTGSLSPSTRRAISKFQARENLIPSGTVDFDLIQRLEQKTQGLPSETEANTLEAALLLQEVAAQADQRPAPDSPVSTAQWDTSSPMPTCEEFVGCGEGYQNLYDLVQDQFN